MLNLFQHRTRLQRTDRELAFCLFGEILKRVQGKGFKPYSNKIQTGAGAFI